MLPNNPYQFLIALCSLNSSPSNIRNTMFTILICALFAAAGAFPVEEEHHIEYHAHPKYSFEYKVEDPHTHDMKSQWEKRDGDKVVGQYTIAEPDGTKRIVDYTADKHNGFNAVVRREGHAHHPEVYKHYEGYGHEQELGLGQQQFGGQINEIGRSEFEGVGFRGYGGQIGGDYGA